MIKQKRVKVKQAILPFILEKTYEIITPRAGLVLFGEFLHGLRLNQRTDKYLPLPPHMKKRKKKNSTLYGKDKESIQANCGKKTISAKAIW